MNKILSYRGLIADSVVERINLHTIDGKTGYKITKFQVMPKNPTADVLEAVIKIYRIHPGSASNTIDFSDNTLLAAAYIENHDDASSGFSNFTDAIIFDNSMVNQDIYVSSATDTVSDGINYYFELEQIALDLNEATVATLKNIRNND